MNFYKITDNYNYFLYCHSRTVKEMMLMDKFPWDTSHFNLKRIQYDKVIPLGIDCVKTNCNPVNKLDDFYYWSINPKKYSWIPNGFNVVFSERAFSVLDKYDIIDSNVLNLSVSLNGTNHLFKALYPFARFNYDSVIDYNRTRFRYLDENNNEILKENVSFNNFQSYVTEGEKLIGKGIKREPSNLVLKKKWSLFWYPGFDTMISEDLLDELILNGINIPVVLIEKCKISYSVDKNYSSIISKEYDNNRLIYDDTKVYEKPNFFILKMNRLKQKDTAYQELKRRFVNDEFFYTEERLNVVFHKSFKKDYQNVFDGVVGYHPNLDYFQADEFKIFNDAVRIRPETYKSVQIGRNKVNGNPIILRLGRDSDYKTEPDSVELDLATMEYVIY